MLEDVCFIYLFMFKKDAMGADDSAKMLFRSVLVAVSPVSLDCF